MLFGLPSRSYSLSSSTCLSTPSQPPYTIGSVGSFMNGSRYIRGLAMLECLSHQISTGYTSLKQKPPTTFSREVGNLDDKVGCPDLDDNYLVQVCSSHPGATFSWASFAAMRRLFTLIIFKAWLAGFEGIEYSSSSFQVLAVCQQITRDVEQRTYR